MSIETQPVPAGQAETGTQPTKWESWVLPYDYQVVTRSLLEESQNQMT